MRECAISMQHIPENASAQRHARVHTSSRAAYTVRELQTTGSCKTGSKGWKFRTLSEWGVKAGR